MEINVKEKMLTHVAGQISGFLAMHDFLQRFAQPAASTDAKATQTATGYYKFSDVRSGLIVGLVCDFAGY